MVEPLGKGWLAGINTYFCYKLVHVEPLGKGRLAGIPYEQGGGISMHAPNGSSIYIQYHPGSGHHGVMPYYKISSGKNGIVRYYINGERVQ